MNSSTRYDFARVDCGDTTLMAERLCSVEDCGKPVKSRGWCAMHYLRWRKEGDPGEASERMRGQGYVDPLPRFLARIEVEPGGCWRWTGNTNGRAGYGRFSVLGKKVYAHRWSYEHHVGPIPEGLDLDHLCRNPRCVNPAHLEAVTHQENVRRGAVSALRPSRKVVA